MAEEEDEFEAGLLRLQNLHRSRLQALQGKIDQLESVNAAQEKELKDLKEVAVRLQKAVKAADVKIKQLAAVISEQCIILRQNGYPQMMSGTNNSSWTGPGQAGQTCLPLFDSPSVECEDALEGHAPIPPDAVHVPLDMSSHKVKDKSTEVPSVASESVKRKHKDKSDRSSVASSKSTTSGSVGVCPPLDSPLSPTLLVPPVGTKEGPCHVLYSHTHNTTSVTETPKVQSEVLNGVTTSVRDGVHSNGAVLASADQRGDNGGMSTSVVADRGLSLRRDNVGNKVRYKTVNRPHLVLQTEQNSHLVRDSSSPTSPSLLATSPSILSSESPMGRAVSTPEKEEEPMSCSMFATMPLDRTEIGATPTSKTSNPDHVTSCGGLKQTPKRKTVDQIAMDLNTKVGGVPEPEMDMVGVVPVTPGVKSVEKIHVDDKWIASRHHMTARKEGEESMPHPAPSSPGVKGEGGAGRTKKLAARGNGTLKYPLRKHTYNLQSVSGSRKRLRNETLGQDERLGERSSKRVQGSGAVEEGMVMVLASNQRFPTRTESTVNSDALRVAKRAGLPTAYKCETKILKAADRDKLDGKACPDCKEWYGSGGDGVHENQRAHLRRTCRHKHLHLPPDTDPRAWDISFPDTED